MNGLVPQKWHEVFGKVLAKKPDDRYQTATRLRAGPRVLPRLVVRRGLGDDGRPVTIASPPRRQTRGEHRHAGAAASVAGSPGRPPRGAAARPSLASRPPDAGRTLARSRRGHGEAPSPAVAAPSGRGDGACAAPAATPVRAGRTSRCRRTLDRAAPPPRRRSAAARSASVSTAPGDMTMRPPAAALPRRPAAFAEPRRRRQPAVPPRVPRIPLPGCVARRAAPLAALALVVALGAWLRSGLGGSAGARPARSRLPTSVPSAAPVAPPPGARRHVRNAARGERPRGGARDGRRRGRAGRRRSSSASCAFGSYEVQRRAEGYEPQRRRVELDETRAVRGAAPHAGAPRRAHGRQRRDPLDAPGRLGQRRRQPRGPDAAARSSSWRPARTGRDRERGLRALDEHARRGRRARRGQVDVRLQAVPKAAPRHAGPGGRRPGLPERAGRGGHARRASSRAARPPTRPASAPRLKSGQRVSVLVRFVVTRDGEVTDIEVVESAGKVVDDAVVAAVRKLEVRAGDQGRREGEGASPASARPSSASLNAWPS